MESSRQLRAGVIGVGYLGFFHAQKYAALPETQLTAVVDNDPERAASVAAQVGAQAFTDYHDVLDRVDLVSIAVPTVHHYQVARDCLEAGVHVLLEKPITQTVAEADELIALAHRRGLTFQIGHLERFNPGLRAVQDQVRNPLFIEAHRLAPFKPRGTDVDVVLDLMIHDIDITLSIVSSPLIRVQTVGTPVITDRIDIANARLQFANGCVANITASRVSQQAMRKMRVFQRDAYISIDGFTRKVRVYRKKILPGDMEPGAAVDAEEISYDETDLLMTEIQAFISAAQQGQESVVPPDSARQALSVALDISRSIAEQAGGSFGGEIQYSAETSE